VEVVRLKGVMRIKGEGRGKSKGNFHVRIKKNSLVSLVPRKFYTFNPSSTLDQHSPKGGE